MHIEEVQEGGNVVLKKDFKGDLNMENEKKKKVKKVLKVLAVILVIFLILQPLGMGWFGGIGPLRKLNDINMGRAEGNAEKYSFDDIERLQGNSMQGKNLLVLGSSVTYGACSLRNGPGEYFEHRWGCSLIKEAVSGTTLVDSGDKSYVQRLSHKVDPTEKVDLFICQLSTNDASKKKPLGEISTSMKLEDFDTTTITGAMEYIIGYVKETWNFPVVFYTGSRYESQEYQAMVDRLFELQQKWGIGVLDLWSGDAFNDISEEQRSLYMIDDIHPTKAGYRDWWCPEMEKQMAEYFEDQ